MRGEFLTTEISSRLVKNRGETYVLTVVMVPQGIRDHERLQSAYNQLELANKELRLLQEVNNALNSTADVNKILQVIAEGIVGSFDYTSSLVALLSIEASTLP